MYNDIASLQAFYASDLGCALRECVGRALAAYLPVRLDERVMGFGYALPWLDEFRERSERCLAMMPARQGAQIWPDAEAVASCLVFEENLPLPDNCLDRILLVHALEHAEDAFESLRELWRVLIPYGHIVIVVANRHGVWSGADHTPFGNGEPYSRAQLGRLLLECGFVVHSFTEIVHLWPDKKWQVGRFSRFYERLSRLFFPYFGGVLLAHAQRQSEPALPARQHLSRRFFVPALAPQVAYPVRKLENCSKRDCQSQNNLYKRH